MQGDRILKNLCSGTCTGRRKLARFHKTCLKLFQITQWPSLGQAMLELRPRLNSF
jgi:hypothetical protein